MVTVNCNTVWSDNDFLRLKDRREGHNKSGTT